MNNVGALLHFKTGKKQETSPTQVFEFLSFTILYLSFSPSFLSFIRPSRLHETLCPKIAKGFKQTNSSQTNTQLTNTIPTHIRSFWYTLDGGGGCPLDFKKKRKATRKGGCAYVVFVRSGQPNSSRLLSSVCRSFQETPVCAAVVGHRWW